MKNYNVINMNTIGVFVLMFMSFIMNIFSILTLSYFIIEKIKEKYYRKFDLFDGSIIILGIVDGILILLFCVITIYTIKHRNIF